MSHGCGRKLENTHILLSNPCSKEAVIIRKYLDQNENEYHTISKFVGCIYSRISCHTKIHLSSHCGTMESVVSLECQNAVSIPGLAPWVKDLVSRQLPPRSQLQLRSDPLPGNSICLRTSKKKRKKKKNNRLNSELKLKLLDENTGGTWVRQSSGKNNVYSTGERRC